MRTDNEQIEVSVPVVVRPSCARNPAIGRGDEGSNAWVGDQGEIGSTIVVVKKTRTIFHRDEDVEEAVTVVVSEGCACSARRRGHEMASGNSGERPVAVVVEEQAGLAVMHHE